MDQRLEFILLAEQHEVSFRELCRRFGISVKTGYKWRDRFGEGGAEALADRSRRPLRSPRQTPEAVSALVLALRGEHPTWGGRKLRQRLIDLGHACVPSASTCTEILRRAGLLTEGQAACRPYESFERAYPNELWQMDHKGHYPTQSGTRCHPLAVTDDHSRFNLLLSAERDQQGTSVKHQLTQAFTLYGLPDAILCDNGGPWGTPDPSCPYTSLTVWLLQLGVRVLHGRPYHPQTQGKQERFNRTLEKDLISKHTWRDLEHCQREFDRYRHIYNCERPHYSLGGATPITRYRPSVRGLPQGLPAIEYPNGTDVRVPRQSGYLTFHNQTWYVGRAFAGLPLGLRPCDKRDGHWDVFFGLQRLGSIDLTNPRPKHQPRSLYAQTESGEADRLPCTPSAQSGRGREPSPLPPTLPSILPT